MDLMGLVLFLTGFDVFVPFFSLLTWRSTPSVENPSIGWPRSIFLKWNSQFIIWYCWRQSVLVIAFKFWTFTVLYNKKLPSSCSGVGVIHVWLCLAPNHKFCSVWTLTLHVGFCHHDLRRSFAGGEKRVQQMLEQRMRCWLHCWRRKDRP